MNPAVMEVLRMVEQARCGVTYSNKDGAVCPACGAVRLKAYKTMPWSGGLRIRYHKCTNADCVLAAMNESVKSLQEDGICK